MAAGGGRRATRSSRLPGPCGPRPSVRRGRARLRVSRRRSRSTLAGAFWPTPSRPSCAHARARGRLGDASPGTSTHSAFVPGVPIGLRSGPTWPGKGPAPPRRDFEMSRHVPPFAEDDPIPWPRPSSSQTRTSPNRSSPALSRWAPCGLSVPAEYGGFAAGRESDYMVMGTAPPRSCPGHSGLAARSDRPRSLSRPSSRAVLEGQAAWLPSSPAARPWRRWRSTIRLSLGRRVHQVTARAGDGGLGDSTGEDLVAPSRAGGLLMRRARTDPVSSKAPAACRCRVPKAGATVTASCHP